MTTTPPSPYDPLPRWSGNDSVPRRRRGVWSVLGVMLAVAFGVFALIHVAILVLMIVVANSYGSNK
jgi:hypothetical protein